MRKFKNLVLKFCANRDLEGCGTEYLLCSGFLRPFLLTILIRVRTWPIRDINKIFT